MYRALAYLQYCSLKNRLGIRLKRLKQPKYLAGGIVGALYFYFYFIRYLFGLRGPRANFGTVAGASDLVLYESIGACLLFVAVVLAWFVPHSRAALTFSEAEVAFLFPAPISRRGLIHFKLLRSQVAILFTTFFLMLVTNRFGGRFWIHAAGWWFILSTLNLHTLGSSFARTMLLDRGITNWQRRVAILGLLLASAVGIGLWAWRTWPPLARMEWDPAQPEQIFGWAKEYCHRLLTSGPVPYLLYPFRLVVRPYLAPSGWAFLKALVPAGLLLGLHYLWVIRSNVAFEEASVEVSRKLAERVAALRAGQWQTPNFKLKGKRAPFRLGPTGPPLVALLWKNLISAGQAFTLRIWITLAVMAVVFCLAMAPTAGRTGLGFVGGMAAGGLLVWSLFLGPQIFRQDLRQDLGVADVLKLYPLRGWQVVLGELLAPAVILTAVQWFLLILAVGLLSPSPMLASSGIGVLAIGVGAAVLVPVLNLITLQIPNAAVLVFPAWFLPGKEGAQGIEVTGQRIIFMLGQVLVFLVSLLPAALAFGVVFLPAKFLLGLNPAIPLASLAAALVLAVEAAFGLVLLGHLFDRFDLSAELSS